MNMPSKEYQRLHNPHSLFRLTAEYIAQYRRKSLASITVPQHVAPALAQAIIDKSIKPALLPIQITESMNKQSIHHQGVCALESLDATSQIVSVACDGKIALCNETSLVDCDVIPTGSGLQSLRIQKKLLRLLVGGINGRISAWDYLTQKLIHTIPAHTLEVNDLSLSCDENLLASCSNDRLVKVWDNKSTLVRAILQGHTKAVRGVSFFDSDTKLASGACDGTVKLWDIEHKKNIFTFHTSNNAAIWCLKILPDEYTVACGLNNGSILLWDLREKNEHYQLQGHSGLVSALTHGNDAIHLASGSWDTTSKCWDLRMNKYVATLLGHTSWVQSISQLHDCAKIISGSRDGMVRAWDTQTITALDSMDLHQAMASADLIDLMQPTTNDERVRLLKKIAQ